MRCNHTLFGLGCSREAEPGSTLCIRCHNIVHGPVWKDPGYRLIAWILLWVVVTAVGVAFAQEKPPQLSADSRVTILKAQLKQKQLESQFLQLQQQMSSIQAQYTEGTKAIQDAIDAAYKEAKLDKAHWTFNLDTLEFSKIPEPKKP